MCVPECMSVYCVHVVPKGVKSASNPLELELQAVVLPLMVAGDQIWVPGKIKNS